MLQELPAKFVREHGDKFYRRASLQTGPSGQVWNVGLNVQVSEIQARVSFGVGWRAFARDNKLETGDLLIFSVVAPSKFVVYIYSHAGTLLKRHIKTTSTSGQIGHPTCDDHVAKFPMRTICTGDEFPDKDKYPVRINPETFKPHSTTSSKSLSEVHQNFEKLRVDRRSKCKPRLAVSRRKAKAARTGLYSQSEGFTKFEEIVRKNGTKSHIVDGKIVKWEPMHKTTGSSTTWQDDPAIDEHSKITEAFPAGSDHTSNFDMDIDQSADGIDRWPTWLDLFKPKQEH